MLMIRPRPNVGEDSLAAYLMYVAERNGLYFAEWAITLGIPWHQFLSSIDVMYGRTSTERFTKDIGLQQNQLNDMVYHCDRWLKRPEVVTLNNRFTIPYTLMRGSKSPVCPQCIKENQIPKQRWDMLLHTRCATHNLRLIEKCPQCESAITWFRRELSRCNCKFPLSELPRIPDHRSPASISSNKILPIAMLVAFNLAVCKGQMRLADLHDISVDTMADLATRACEAIIAGDEDVKKYLYEAMQERKMTGGVFGQRWLLLPALLGLPKYKKESDWLLQLAKEITNTQDFGNDLMIDYITIDEASELLGLSKYQANRLVTKNNLTIIKKNQFKKPLRVDAKSIVAFIKNTSNSIAIVEQSNVAGGVISITEVARILNIYPDAVRRVIKAGLLNTRKGRGTQRVVEDSELRKFNASFVFIRELALEWDTNPTNLAERIRATGIQPVSGPSIDGALVYLFNRSDITESVRIKVSGLNEYETKTGRRKNGAQDELLNGYLTLQAVAESLGTTLLTAATLISRDYLRASTPPNIHHNRYYIHQSDLDSYRRQYRDNPEWIVFRDAALRMAITTAQLQRRHIDSGEMVVESDGLQRYLKLSEVDKLIKMQQDLVVIKKAAMLLCRRRHTILNLVKCGRLKPVKGPTVDGSKRYYFHRKDIEALIASPSDVEVAT